MSPVDERMLVLCLNRHVCVPQATTGGSTADQEVRPAAEEAAGGGATPPTSTSQTSNRCAPTRRRRRATPPGPRPAPPPGNTGASPPRSPPHRGRPRPANWPRAPRDSQEVRELQPGLRTSSTEAWKGCRSADTVTCSRHTQKDTRDC